MAMSDWLASRHFLQHEQMDAPGVDPAALHDGLKFIRRINRMLLYTRRLIFALNDASRTLPPEEEISVLDVATGSADVPEAVLRWAGKSKRAVRVVGVDLHTATLDIAARMTDGRIPLACADALALPFADGAFDVTISSMFLHHLPDELVVAALTEMRRVTRRAVLVADLERDAMAYRWISLFTLLASPLVRHDARVSVRQAFTAAELTQLAARAGMGGTVTRHFGHRLLLRYAPPD